MHCILPPYFFYLSFLRLASLTASILFSHLVLSKLLHKISCPLATHQKILRNYFFLVRLVILSAVMRTYEHYVVERILPLHFITFHFHIQQKKHLILLSAWLYFFLLKWQILSTMLSCKNFFMFFFSIHFSISFFKKCFFVKIICNYRLANTNR